MFIKHVFSVVVFGLSLLGCQDRQVPPPSPLSPLSKYYKEEIQEVAPTDLHKAVLSRDLDAVKFHANNNFDVNATNSKYKETPLQLALELQEPAISEYLAFFPSLDIYHRNDKGEGYLFVASKNGMFRVVHILYDRHEKLDNLIREFDYKNIDFKNSNGQRSLHVVANPETAEALRKSSTWSAFRVYDKDSEGHTPLHQAALDKRDKVLQWAAQRYCSDYDEYFRHSFLPDWLNNFMASGLKFGIEFIRWLSPKKRWDWYNFIAANPFNYPNANYQSALHVAVLKGSTSTVEAIMSCQYTDLTLPDDKGNTALHLAALSRNPKVVETVLNGRLVHTWWTQRSDWLNKKNHEGQTPLHLAAANLITQQNYQLLLNAGANEKILNSNNQSASEIFKSTQALHKFKSRERL